MSNLISIVVPIFNEAEIIRNTLTRLKEEVSNWNEEYEIIFVDDGSDDDTMLNLSAAAEADKKIKVLSFSRNFGHQMAFTAGIDYANGDAVIVIDGDLQDPPQVMRKFIEKWKTGFDIVYGIRTQRKGETFFKRSTAKIFYRLIDFLSESKIPHDSGDFRLMDRNVVDKLKTMRERHRFIRGMVSWVGFNQCAVEYVRDERTGGSTKFTIKKMIRFALDGILSFSTVPLMIVMWMGFFTAGLAMAGIMYALIVRLFTDIWVTGWTTLILAQLFIGGVLLMSMGILGLYVGRIFEELKGRPLYIIDKTINIETELVKCQMNRDITFPSPQ